MKATRHFARSILTVLAALAATHSIVGTSTALDDAYPLSNQIVVRLDRRSGQWPDVATVVARVNSGDPLTNASLAGPTSARYLVENRILPKFLALLPPGDPRVLLHESMVLTYSEAVHTSAAEILLRTDPSV